VTTDVLPDDVLVEIFFHVNTTDWPYVQNPWHALVHVCRRWRYLVFAFPRRLNLRLEYRGHGPISEVLGVWPFLPVTLVSSVEVLSRGLGLLHPKSDQRWDNRVAALESEHYDRICEIRIVDMTDSRWKRFTEAMQKPFPELTYLQVSTLGYGEEAPAPVLPDSFLGGSAPHLRELSLRSIPFPSITRLLLSANGLVTLTLWNIPDSGYISADAMSTALTTMTRLESLILEFSSPLSPPDPASRPLPPPTRFVLPALAELMFKGVFEYLEVLLARIDAPFLYDLYVVFFIDFDFDLPQLRRIIGHAEELKALNHAQVLISNHAIQLDLYHKTGSVYHRERLMLEINCGELDWQLSSLAHVCSSPFPLISTIENLKIRESDLLPSSHWNDNMEDTRWLELLGPFTALKNLYLTDEIARRVCGALGGLSGERPTELLPELRNLFVDVFRSSKNIEKAIRPFVAARQLSGHPVAIDRWRRWR